MNFGLIFFAAILCGVQILSPILCEYGCLYKYGNFEERLVTTTAAIKMSQQQYILPTISGMQIESREEHSFPSTFSKKVNIAVFGFSKEQKEHTKTWQAVFADLKRDGGEWKEKDVDFNVFPLLVGIDCYYYVV